MAAHTNAWNELSPAGSDFASSIDDFMRQMKLDVRERLGLQHYWNAATAEGNNQDGTHKQISITPTGDNVSALKTNSNTTVTGSGTTPLVDLAGTWNTTGVVTGVKVNITNTAAGALSKVLDAQVGGASQFAVDRQEGIRIKDIAWLTASNFSAVYTGLCLAHNITNIASGAVATRGTQADVAKPSWAIDIGGCFGGDGSPWLSDGFTVLRRPAAGSWARVLHATDAGVLHPAGGVALPNGSAAAPGLFFGSDINLGIYRHNADILAITSDGTARWSFGFNVFAPLTDNANDIGNASLRVRKIFAVDVEVDTITTNSGATIGGTIDIPKGSLLSFATDLDTGVGSDADDSLGFYVGNYAGLSVSLEDTATAVVAVGSPGAAGPATGPASALQIGSNASGSGAAGSIILHNKAGTGFVLWVDAVGKLRIHSARPTANGSVSDTAGTVVGAQVA